MFAEFKFRDVIKKIDIHVLLQIDLAFMIYHDCR